MSAVIWEPSYRFEPMDEAWLEAVARLEQSVHAHPWSRRNFSDALQAGYQAQLLTRSGDLLGYFVAMKGVDEVHLLNISVAPAYQGQGWGRMLLDAISVWSRSQGAQWLWLEVRSSNLRALQVYQRYGLRQVGERKDYYPDGAGRRENAVVMSLKL